MGWVSEEQLVMCLSHQYNLPIADMAKLEPEPAAIRIVSMAWAQSHLILPVKILEREVQVILCDPIDVKGTDEIFRVSGLRPRISLATPASLYRAIPRAYSIPTASEDPEAGAKPKKPMKVDDLKDRKHLLTSLSEATTEPSIWSKLAG
jgi:type IV pilus assembly protein PilB